jgi:uncharacterized protein YlxP (DUF503 family)
MYYNQSNSFLKRKVCLKGNKSLQQPTVGETKKKIQLIVAQTNKQDRIKTFYKINPTVKNTIINIQNIIF